MSKCFGLSITEEMKGIEMRIWCIKNGIVLILHEQRSKSLHNSLKSKTPSRQMIRCEGRMNKFSTFRAGCKDGRFSGAE
jgi:hypothetical protein